jgi:DNA polymerase III sliding clamp (beta) subunit (PCNA family)
VGKSLRKDDVVSVKGDERKLAIKTNHLRFGMNLLDPTAVVAPPPVPEAEYDAVVTISTSEFYRALKFAEKIAEHVWFISEKNNFYFKADGDTDRMVYQFDVVDHNKGKAKALYAVEYLDDIARAVNEVESVIISLKSDFPLSVSVEVPQIEFILAPRIEPE